MATLDMLNVAIGMIFVYLLLSLIATAISEIIENILKNRASNLKQGITELIAPKDDERKLIKEFYEHPLICGLYKGNFEQNKRLPSYIPSSSFSKVILNLVLSNHVQPSYAPVISLTSVRDALENWPYKHSKKAMITLLEDAQDDLEVFKANLENWFNSSMDRVSGWYRKKVQVILIIIGFALAFAMNADSIALYKSLVKDAPLRNSLVAASEEFAKGSANSQQEDATTRFNNNLQQINELRLPLGWDWNTAENLNTAASNYSLAIPTSEGKGLFWNWVAKITGLLMTAVAISLGAPFWFDILNKVMVIRSTVKPQEKSKDEGSKDSKK